MQKSNLPKIIIAIVVSELAGIIGSFFTTPSIGSWYATLPKPMLAPPNWVFGPVWTTLFLLMGIAAGIIWSKGLNRKDVKIALSIFIAQLVLNIIWSLLFFGFHNPTAAFIEIIFLWLAILATIFLFYPISKKASWLLLPYILWVSFAAYLNFSFVFSPKTSAKQIPPGIVCTMDAKLCPDGSYVGRTGANCEFVCPDN